MKGDSRYMQRAVTLARKGLGRTAPNPPVGAVVVSGSRIVGEGFHPRAGEPHAEVFALRQAGDAARGATLYVTLEPCSHHGRTPPCVDAVLEAGIARVVVGSVDPNPLVACRGIRALRSQGVKVEVGVSRRQTAELIKWYASWVEKGRPYVIAKAAMTLDGRIAAPSGDSRWISSEESRALVHVLRDRVDGILVGIGTVVEDNPLLTCRKSEGRDPLRIVIDPGYRVPAASHCLGERAVILTARDPGERPEIVRTGSRVIRLTADREQRFPGKTSSLRSGGWGCMPCSWRAAAPCSPALSARGWWTSCSSSSRPSFWAEAFPWCRGRLPAPLQSRSPSWYQG